MRQRSRRGSFTIEAAVIIPFFLFLMLTVLRMGIGFYQDACLQECSIKWESFDAVSLFYKVQMLEELGEEFLQNGF